MSTKNVAIVGAGMAGLVCGNILSNAGFNVTVFDKGRFNGGRMASRGRDANTFDYGAQYFTARDPKFRGFLAGLLRKGKVGRWNGNFGRFSGSELQKERTSEPRYVGIPGMRSIADELAASLNCLLSHRVVDVAKQSGKWHLTGIVTNEPEELTFTKGGFDCLVLNMPPWQASAIHPCDRLDKIQLLPCCALLLTFESRLELDFDGVKVDDEVLSWVARDSSKPGRNSGERWVVHASAQWSDDNFHLSAGEIQATLTKRLADVFKIALPSISFSKLHKWKFALPISPPSSGCVSNPESAVVYCGDWCLGSRVEGAFLSGIAAAERILGTCGLFD